MKCYICGEEMIDWKIHAKRYHPKHWLPFWWYFEVRQGRKETLLPLQDEPEKTPTFKDFPDRFKWVRDHKIEKIRYKLSQSAVVSHLESFPEWEKIDAEFIPNDFFDYSSEALVAIRRVHPQDIPFDISTRFQCMECGGYAQKRLCPPQISTVSFYQDYVKKWKQIYILIWQTDGLAGWYTRPEGSGERKFGRSLRGADEGISISVYKVIKQIVFRLRKQGLTVTGSSAGPCKYCSKYLKGDCRLPPKSCPKKLPLVPTAEAMGIDCYQLLWSMDIPVQYPCFDFLTKMGMIFVR